MRQANTVIGEYEMLDEDGSPLSLTVAVRNRYAQARLTHRLHHVIGRTLTAVADRFGIPTVYDNWKALVTASDSDAIVIGTWPYLHKPAAVTALEAGKHVLCEARMALNLAEARAMQEAAQARPHLTAQLVPAPMTLEVDAFVASLLAERAARRRHDTRSPDRCCKDGLWSAGHLFAVPRHGTCSACGPHPLR